MTAAINILDGTGDGDDTDLSATSFAGSPSGTTGTVLASDTTPTTLFESELEGIAATTNISVAVSTLLTFADLTDNNLNLAQTAGNSVTFTAPTFTMLGAATDTITTAGGALTVVATTAAIGGLNTNGGLITLDLATNGTVSGTIAGAGTALTKSGSGTLDLTATNTYTGATNVDAGTLTASNGAAIPDASAVIVAPGATFNLNASETIGSLAGAGSVTLGANALTTGGNDSDTAFSGSIAGIAASALNKAGTGEFTLSGDNSAFDGTIAINGGVLVAAHANALGSTTGATTVANLMTLEINNVAIGNEAVNLGGVIQGRGTASLSGAITLTTNNVAANVVTAGSLTLSGAIDDGASAFGLSKAGAGTLTLSGVNTYDGITQVNGGTLIAANNAALGSAAGATTIIAGSTLNIANGITVAEAITVNGSGTDGNGALTGTGTAGVSGAITLGTSATVGAAATSTLTLSGVISDGAGTSLTKAGPGTVVLSNSGNTYTGATSINGGVLSISNDGNLGTAPGAPVPGQLTFDGGTLAATASLALNANRGVTFNAGGGTIQVDPTFTLTYNGNAAGPGGLTKTGTGTLALGGSNTYGGTTTVSAGTLSVSGGSAIADLSGVIVQPAATFDLQASETIGSLSDGATAGGTVALNANTLTTGGDNSNTAFAGQITGTGGLGKAGTGTFTLGGNNTYDGSTLVAAGTLVAANANALGSNLAGTTVNAGANLTIDNVSIASGESVTLNGGTALSGVGTASLNGAVLLNASSTVTVDASDTLTLSGVIGGAAFGLTKAGTGTLVLSNAANAYGGATTVNAGTLLVNGSIAASATTVNSAATLGGTNGTLGTVDIASGGTLSPGASAGRLTADGAVTFTSGAIFRVEIGGTTAGADYDQLVAGGSVSLANATLNALLLGSPVAGTTYTIIEKTSPGAVSGTFNGIANGSTVAIGGRAFQIDYAGGDGNDVTLALGALKVSGTDPVAVLADVNTTTDNGINSASPTQSVARQQILNGDINATVNAAVTVDGFGLSISTTKSGGTVDFTNNGAVVANDAAADGGAVLVLNGNGGGVHYSGAGTVTNHASTPNSNGLSITSTGGVGGSNLIEVAGSITGQSGIVTSDGATNIVVSGAVTGTGGTAIFFGSGSSGNNVDLKPAAVITGNLAGSGNDDAVRLSGTSGSGTFDLGKIVGGFSQLTKVEGATWTVTGTFADPSAATTIVNGALLVNGTIAGNVTVGTGFSEPLPVPPALLGGSGTVADVLVQDRGVLAPGASAGTLTVAGNLTMTPGSILRIEIGGTGAGQFDLLNANGTAPDTGAIELGAATLTGSLIGGFTPSLGQVFKIIDNAGSDAILSPFSGISEGAGVNFGGQTFAVSYVGGDGNDVTLTAAANGAPGLTGFGPAANVTQAGAGATPQILDADVTFTDVEGNFDTGTLVVAGLLAEDTVSVPSTSFDPGDFFIDEQGAVDDLYFSGTKIGTISGGTGSTLTVTFNNNANPAAIDALIEHLTLLDTASNPTFGRDLTLTVTDADGASTGPRPLHVNVFNGEIAFGTSGDDSFAPTGNAHIDAGGGNDTIMFDFRLVDATVIYSGNQVIVDAPSRHMVLSGFEKYVFTDGTVDNNDGDVLVDDLFYYSTYHDVWNAQADADTHFHGTGWKEGRDPDAFFSTVVYLTANPDVKAVGVDPLRHFDQSGWKEGRVPSINFDPAQYLDANPDVKAAGVDPLAHFLQFGAGEGRLPFAPTELVCANGFDYVHYLNNNPDVKAAGVDPFQHFQQFGWQEGRNPNALFDTNGYLAHYADVAAAHVNPLDHYNQFGWKEGRDPSVNFDTTDYLAAYADVNAAHVNPLTHFLHFGIHEGRSDFADGVWG